MSDQQPLENRNWVTRESLRPITVANTQLEIELQQLEVESTFAAD